METPRAIRLPRAHAEAMIAHARAGRPEEVCGLVACDQAGAIVATLPVVNAATNKIITYHMEPGSQYRAFDQIDKHGWELYGIYHSHPASVPYPSLTDRGLAFDPYDDIPLYPDAVYFIIGLADPATPIIRAYLLPDPETIEELPVEIVG
ncbi:MAG: M67 family metallopeptidase [Ardenticatenaceae bacterium]|nr:M67 family metallopeptidase [Ardenticatenaceae bacterium]